MKTSQTTYLTDKFFLVFGLVHLLGVISLIYPIILGVYVALVVFLAFLAWSDRRSLVDSGIFVGSIETPHLPELGKTVVLKCHIETRERKVLRLSRLTLITPELKRLSLSDKATLLRPGIAGQDKDRVRRPDPTRGSGAASPDPGKRKFQCNQGIHFEANLVGVASALGYEEIHTLTVSTYSRFRMWFRRIPVKLTSTCYRVVPSHEKISERAFIQLKSYQPLFYQGTRQIMRGRAADQFYSVRKYQFPDPIRHIDQKKTAKYNQLMTRTFDSLYHHHVVMALDVGRAMCGKFYESNKSDYYLSACLILARNALLHHDRISFFAFSQSVHHLIAGAKTMVPFHPIFRGSESVQPRTVESDFEVVNQTLSRLVGQRGIVLIFTDISVPSVQEALLESLPSICHRHLTVVISLLDESYSLDEKILAYTQKSHTVDNYARLLYTYWVNERVILFRNKVARLGGGVLVVSQKDWLSIIIRLYAMLRHSLHI